MSAWYIKRILTILAVIALIVIGVFLLRGGNNTKDKPASSETTQQMTLPDYASTDATVSSTTDGTINGDDVHRQIQIIVGQTERTLNIIQGYNGHVISTKSYANNQAAYSVFLSSLQTYNFLSAKKNVKNTDPNGQCPLGYRYIFQLTQGSQQISNLWASTCSGVGTFAGSTNNILVLFQRQITDYSKLTQQVAL